MSNSGHIATSGDGPQGPATTAVQSPTEPRRRRRLLVGGACVVILLGVLGAGFVTTRDQGSRDDRSVVLPDSFAGLAPSEENRQFADHHDWRDEQAETFDYHPIDGRAYGAGPLVNLVVARTDTSKKLDAIGRPPWTRYGAVSCTHTFQFPKLPGADTEPKPILIETMLLCRKVQATLTVNAFVLSGGEGFEVATATAVDETWALQQ